MYCLISAHRYLDFNSPWGWVYAGLILAGATYTYFRSTKRRQLTPAELAQPHAGWRPPD